MATERALELSGKTVTAAAPMSGPYALEVAGCGTATLAPPRYRRDAFSFFPPLVLSTGPKPQAVVAFSRANITKSSSR